MPDRIETTSLFAARWIAVPFVYIFACIFAVIHLAQWTGLSFAACSGAAAAVSIVAAVALVRTFLSERKLERVPDRAVLAGLIGFCLAGAAMASLNFRVDEDDYYNLPNAVWHAANPGEPMGFVVRFLYAEPPYVSPNWSTSQAWEYALGIVARWSGTNILDVTYLWVPAIVGFLIPLAWFLALSRFSFGPAEALAGAVVTVGMVLLMGDGFVSWGNFTFTRAWQGKCFLLSAGVPLFLAFTMDLLERPSRKAWLALTATCIACLGASATSIVLLPATGGLLLLAEAFARRRARVEVVRNAILVAAALSYVMLFALGVLEHSVTTIGANSEANIRWPSTLWGQISMLSDDIVFTPVVLVVSLILAPFVLTGWLRRLVEAWIALALVFLFNPVVAPYVIPAVTQNLYWRLFSALPFPLVIGLVAGELWRRVSGQLPATRSLLATAVVATLVAAHFVPGTPSVFEYRRGTPREVEIAPFRYRLDRDRLIEARDVVSVAPPGAMLAPESIAGIVLLVSARHPQMRSRAEAEWAWSAMQGDASDGWKRVRASDYLGGAPEGHEDLVALVLRYRAIRTLVARIAVWSRPEVGDAMRAAGFVERARVSGFVVASRD